MAPISPAPPAILLSIGAANAPLITDAAGETRSKKA
jgi:hypothetical protein